MMMISISLSSCLYGVFLTITITAVFPFFSFFCSFFLTLKKKAHARQKQNKVNIFSTTKNQVEQNFQNFCDIVIGELEDTNEQLCYLIK
jgi:hypothetical protein